MSTPQPWLATNRKRDREEDEEALPSLGFGAHRDKRHFAALPYRSPNNQRNIQPQTFTSFQIPAGFQATSLITPDDSSNENSPIKQDCEDDSCFSPYTTSPSMWPDYASSPMLQASLAFSAASSADTTMFGDHEMTEPESYNLSPGPYQPDRDSATTIRERIPTPRHTNFFTSSSHMDSTDLQPRGHTRQPIRLPSPISEGEPSPNVQLGGLAYVSMDLEVPSSPLRPIPIDKTEDTSPSPNKKGHSRSRHILRGSSGLSGAPGGKRKFSMGYRNDCEKCRNNVPGHFSHIDVEYD